MRCKGRGSVNYCGWTPSSRFGGFMNTPASLDFFADAIDDPAAGFYVLYGFEAFADEPLKLFLPVQ
jgi:hypothetical protein